MDLLTVRNLSVVYGAAITAATGVTLSVPAGRMTALLGANGAGKSTVLKAISGTLEFERGRITEGSIQFDGQDITTLRAHKRARRGLLHVREGRHVLPAMTVEDNLCVAGFSLIGRGTFRRRQAVERIYEWFPVLGQRRRGLAGFLSGGEQQMLAIGRALAGDPRLILVDEASLGLAPMVAAQIFEILGRINAETGLSILIVEQNVGLALKYASHVHVLENGRVALEGPPSAIGSREAISARYLGGTAGPRPAIAGTA